MTRLVLVLVLVAAAVAACGGGDDDDAAAPAGEVITQTSAPPAETGEAPEGATGATATDGKTLFTQNCSGCHTLADAGTTARVGPNLDETTPTFERVVEMVTNGGGGGLGVMPAFKGSLSEEKIEAIARYVSENAGK
jgi:mono/diheme cytochrome c family protein